MDQQFDELMNAELGKGVYQVVLLILCFLFSFCSTDSIAINFLAGKSSFYCNNDNNHIDDFGDHIANRNNFSATQLFYRSSNLANTCNAQNCTEWKYDRSVYVSTIITEFDLVCKRAWLVDLVSSCFMAGRFFSCLTHGYFSDRYGRKKVLIGSHILKLVGGVMSLYSPNYPVFALSRFIIAAGSTASCMASFVLLVESTGDKWRRKFGVMFSISIAIGGIILPAIAYMVRDFRKLQAVYTWPQIVLLLCFMILEESPRWLASQGMEDEAKKVLERISLINKKGILIKDSIRFDNVTFKRSDRLNTKIFSGFFTTKALALKTPILWFSWFVSSLIYYAFSLNIGRLPGNIYLNTFLITLVEIPANPITILSMEKFGGRLTLAIFTIAASCSCFVMIPFMFYPNQEYAVTAFGILGKGLITVSYNTMYVETAETYPTRIRSQAMGISASFGRLSSMASSFLGGVMADIWAPLPSVIFGAFAMISGLLFFVFPKVRTGDLVVNNISNNNTRKSQELKILNKEEAPS